MSHFVLSSVALKSIVATLVVAAGTVGAHGTASEASQALRVGEHRHAESLEVGFPAGPPRACRAPRSDAGDDRGHDSGDDGNGHRRSSTGLQQHVIVLTPATTFLRLDRAGQVTAAATNTGCAPRNGDQVFLFRANGKIEQATSLPDCRLSGDFSVAGRFQPEHCGPGDHQGNDDGSNPGHG